MRPAARLAEAELLTALDEAVRSGMVEEVPSRRLAYRFTHELVRRALYDRLTGLRRAELHLAVGQALEADEDRSPRALADLAHHFAPPRRSAGRSAASNTTCSRPGRRSPRLPSTKGRLASARRSISGSRARPCARRRCSSSVRPAIARETRSLRSRPSRRRRTSPANWGTLSCSLAPRSATRMRVGARASPIRERSSCSRRRPPRSATEAPSCASECSAGSPVRWTSRATTSAARSSARAPSTWPGG